MVRVPVLMVNEGKGKVHWLEIQSRPGDGRLYLDTNLRFDDMAHGELRLAFGLLRADRDLLIRDAEPPTGAATHCLCGPSLGLALYLGMVTALRGQSMSEGVFATGTVDQDGKVLPVGGLAEKMRAALEQANRFIVPAGQGVAVGGDRGGGSLDSGTGGACLFRTGWEDRVTEVELCETTAVDAAKLVRVKEVLLDDETAQAMAEFFRALSDPTRVKIVHALAQEDLCVHELAAPHCCRLARRPSPTSCGTCAVCDWSNTGRKGASSAIP